MAFSYSRAEDPGDLYPQGHDAGVIAFLRAWLGRRIFSYRLRSFLACSDERVFGASGGSSRGDQLSQFSSRSLNAVAVV